MSHTAERVDGEATRPKVLVGREYELVKRMTNTFKLRNAGIVYALAIVLITFTILNAQRGQPGYLRGLNLSDILDSASLVGIVVTFATIVLISGNFDLSVGSVAAFGGIVTLSLGQDHSMLLAIPAAILAGALCGAVNGVLVQYVGINAFIVTLGTLTAISGIVLVVSNGQSTILTNPHSLAALAVLGVGDWSVPGAALIAGLILLAAAAAAWFRKDRRSRLAITSSLAVLGIAGLVTGLTVPYSVTLSKPTWYYLGLTAIAWWVLNYTV